MPGTPSEPHTRDGSGAAATGGLPAAVKKRGGGEKMGRGSEATPHPYGRWGRAVSLILICALTRSCPLQSQEDEVLG